MREFKKGIICKCKEKAPCHFRYGAFSRLDEKASV